MPILGYQYIDDYILQRIWAFVLFKMACFGTILFLKKPGKKDSLAGSPGIFYHLLIEGFFWMIGELIFMK